MTVFSTPNRARFPNQPSELKATFAAIANDLSALRLARAYTGKDSHIVVEGGYHGIFDSVLWYVDIEEWGDTAEPPIEAECDGIPKVLKPLSHFTPLNDADYLEDLLKKYHKDVGAFLHGHRGHLRLERVDLLDLRPQPHVEFADRRAEIADAGWGIGHQLGDFDVAAAGRRCGWGGLLGSVGSRQRDERETRGEQCLVHGLLPSGHSLP